MILCVYGVPLSARETVRRVFLDRSDPQSMPRARARNPRFSSNPLNDRNARARCW